PLNTAYARPGRADSCPGNCPRAPKLSACPGGRTFPLMSAWSRASPVRKVGQCLCSGEGVPLDEMDETAAGAQLLGGPAVPGRGFIQDENAAGRGPSTGDTTEGRGQVGGAHVSACPRPGLTPAGTSPSQPRPAHQTSTARGPGVGGFRQKVLSTTELMFAMLGAARTSRQPRLP